MADVKIGGEGLIEKGSRGRGQWKTKSNNAKEKGLTPGSEGLAKVLRLPPGGPRLPVRFGSRELT